MRSRVLGIAAGVCLLAGTVAAQAPEMPKPGPEQKRLGYFVGSWKTEGETKQSPFGPAGKLTETARCEWFAGGFHLVCRGEAKGPMGVEKNMYFLGYDPEEKVYTYSAINSMGFGALSKGTVQDKTWSWANEMKMKGKTMKGRFTLTETSANEYTWKFESSEDGNTWTEASEGKSTRVVKKAAPAKK